MGGGNRLVKSGYLVWQAVDVYAAQVTKMPRPHYFDDQLLTNLLRLHNIQHLTMQKPAYTPVYVIYIPLQHIFFVPPSGR